LDPEQATTDDEFEKTWERFPPRSQSRPIKVRVPRVGIIVQRSAAVNRRKLQALLQTPSPPSPRRREPARGTPGKPTQSKLEELFGDLSDLSGDEETDNQPPVAAPPVVHGPCGPPPMEVTVGDTVIHVPYFVAVVSRVWRTRIGGQRAILRFDRDGRCIYKRVV